MLERREMTEQTDWWVKQPSQVACFSEDLKCWGAWNTSCPHKAKDIMPSTIWRKEAWKEVMLDNLLWKDERGPSSIRWTLQPFQRQRWRNFWEMEWSAYVFFLKCMDTILNWTELKWTSFNNAVTVPLNITFPKTLLSVFPCHCTSQHWPPPFQHHFSQNPSLNISLSMHLSNNFS